MTFHEVALSKGYFVFTFSAPSETVDFRRLAASIENKVWFLPHKVGKYAFPLKVVYLNYISQAWWRAIKKPYLLNTIGF